MNPIAPVPANPGPQRVGDRGQGRRQPGNDGGEQFRRALQERGSNPGEASDADDQPDDRPAGRPPTRQPANRPANTPAVPRGLQQQRPGSRRDQGNLAHHVDVLA